MTQAQRRPVEIVTISERLGHSKVAMTLDVYGHLFPSKDDGQELVEGERALLGQ